jgi:hypothetical protein
MKTIFGNTAPLPGNNEPVNPMDLVMQLGRTRRFNGSANPEWTVLHHSLLVQLIWLKTYGPEGLEHIMGHDFHEYVTGDIPSPVKAAIGREAIEKVQDELDRRIRESLHIQEPDAIDKGCVKYVDWAALFIEAHYIGLPGHVRHIVDTSMSGLNLEARRHIWDAIDATCPEVTRAMAQEAVPFWTVPGPEAT